MGKIGEVAGRTKQSGVSRYSTQNTGVFVLYLALNNSLPKSSVMLRGRNRGTATRGRIEESVRHAKHGQMPVAEVIQAFIGKPRQHNPQHNEPNIAVGRNDSGISRKRNGESCRQK